MSEVSSNKIWIVLYKNIRRKKETLGFQNSVEETQ